VISSNVPLNKSSGFLLLCRADSCRRASQFKRNGTSDRSFHLARLPKEQQLKLSTLHCARSHADKFRRLASHPELFPVLATSSLCATQQFRNVSFLSSRDAIGESALSSGSVRGPEFMGRSIVEG
jgi:hypothetical protein